MKKYLLLVVCLVLAFGLMGCKPQHTDESEQEAIEQKGTELITKYVEENIKPLIPESCTLGTCQMYGEAVIAGGQSCDNVPSRVVEAELKSYGNKYIIYVDTATGIIYTDFFYRRNSSEIKEIQSKIRENVKESIKSYFTNYISEDDFVVNEIIYEVGNKGCTYFYIDSLDLYDPTDKKKINTISELTNVLPGDIDTVEEYEEFFSAEVNKLEVAYYSEKQKVFPEELFKKLSNDNFKYSFNMKNVSGADELEKIKKDSNYWADSVEVYTYSTDGTYNYEANN